MNKIIILNGPNLNLLGEREKEKYGNITLIDIEKNCKELAKKNNIILSFFQSNIEGELVEKIQKARNDGVKIIKGEFIPTKKNKPAENFYENFGFKKQDNFWIFDTNQSIKKPTNLKMKIENE